MKNADSASTWQNKIFFLLMLVSLFAALSYLACLLRRRLDRVRSQLVEGLDDQRRQRQRVWACPAGQERGTYPKPIQKSQSSNQARRNEIV
jgi:hypothetical protein